jgi:hypothetical protein
MQRPHQSSLKHAARGETFHGISRPHSQDCQNQESKNSEKSGRFGDIFHDNSKYDTF